MALIDKLLFAVKQCADNVYRLMMMTAAMIKYLKIQKSRLIVFAASFNAIITMEFSSTNCVLKDLRRPMNTKMRWLKVRRQKAVFRCRRWIANLSKIARNKIRYETVGFIFTFCLWLTRIAALINWSHLAHGQGLHLIVAFIKNANINHVVPHLITILSAHCFRSLAICFVVVAEHTFNAEHFLTRFHRSR